MWVTNAENREIDFYIGKTWVAFKAQERKNLTEQVAIGLLERLPYWRFILDQKDIACIEKSDKGVTIILKNGKRIVQKKPDEMRFNKIHGQMDHKKYQVAIFMKNIITHYSGGRYWAWLLGHILADDPGIQVTFITNQKPPFGKSFDCYNLNNIFIYTCESKDLYRMGERISKNPFDCILGIPIEGGLSAQAFGDKWAMKFYCMLFESPNFIRDFRGGPDSEDMTWFPYVPVLQKSEKVINNTEIGKDYLDKWDKLGDFDSDRSAWLWNSTNTKVADKVEQKEHSKPNEYHIIFVGRLIGFKRTIHIVRVLNLLGPKYDKNKKLIDPGKKFTLNIISGRSGGIMKQMMDEALPHIKIIFHDKVDDYEKFRLIKLSNMMVFLSSFEGFGIPPMEALYCERVCIAYPLPILKLIYKDHLVYTKDNDIEHTAKMVEKWLENSEAKKEHIAKAKKYINEVASHNRVRKDFFKLTGLKENEKQKPTQERKFQPGPRARESKLTFGIIVCNGAQFIIPCLKHIYNMADEIIICEGAVEQFDSLIGSFYSNDGTVELIKQFMERNDSAKKIKFITTRRTGRAWKDKLEMQNVIAEKTTGDIFIKQDVDEFYDLDGLRKEIDRMEKEKGRVMINYKSYHFWGDCDHIIKGANFNDKQTRVWKWRPTFRYLKTFNWVTDTATGEYMAPGAGNSLLSEDTLFHYSYLYKNKSRLDVLKYYAKRGLGDHRDVYRAWINKNPNMLEGGRKVEAINLKHPIDDETMEEIST